MRADDFGSACIFAASKRTRNPHHVFRMRNFNFRTGLPPGFQMYSMNWLAIRSRHPNLYYLCTEDTYLEIYDQLVALEAWFYYCCLLFVHIIASSHEPLSIILRSKQLTLIQQHTLKSFQFKRIFCIQCSLSLHLRAVVFCLQMVAMVCILLIASKIRRKANQIWKYWVYLKNDRDYLDLL